ncbi:MAG: hypothetical protein ACN6I5_04935 [Hyphomicrobiales bacterium]
MRSMPPASATGGSSWCGSAIAHRDTDEATTAADIIYRTGARTEGYAVVWRAARATFRMIRGLYPIADGTTPSNVRSPLNISQRGRPTGNNRIGGGREKFGATGGFRRVHTLPYDYDDGTDDYQLMAAWPKLNYPATSKYDAMGIQWEKARRPAYVVLELADAHDTLCPVGVYHAPSNQVRSSWGAFMSGLARELYAVNGIDAHDVPEADQLVALTKCVFGGDFNWSQSQASWPGEYEILHARSQPQLPRWRPVLREAASHRRRRRAAHHRSDRRRCRARPADHRAEHG